MTDWLPSVGWLPYFLLYTSAASFIHAIVCYAAPPSASLKQFSGPNAPAPEALTARVYGIKNSYAGLIRLYAAYNLGNQQVYDLAIWTYVGVLALYVCEYTVWKTARERELAIPFLNAGVGLIWMVAQRSWYSRL